MSLLFQTSVRDVADGGEVDPQVDHLYDFMLSEKILSAKDALASLLNTSSGTA